MSTDRHAITLGSRVQVIPGNDQNTSPTNQKTARCKLEPDNLADVLWPSMASKQLFRYFDINLLTVMPSHIPSEKSGI